jgi:hypothetical protein
MSFSPNPSNPALCEDISQLLHALLIKAQKQNPKLLTEPWQHCLTTASPAMQRARITALLQQQVDAPHSPVAIAHILKQFFIPAFHHSKTYSQALERLQELITAKISQSPAPEPIHNSEFTGLLLVDAENINLPAGLENYLKALGHDPIHHRLAFGNWHKLGRRDQEFHQRGYQMVHVPSGKNSADIKMCLYAFLISRWNPSIREVFICSTDTDLLQLGYTLLELGVLPYRITRHRDDLTVINVAEQKTRVISLSQIDQKAVPIDLTSDNSATETKSVVESLANPETVTVPTLDQMQDWLQTLILQEQQANPGQPITISRLGKLFRDRNLISANQALKANSNYKTLKQFLSAHPAFDLSPLSGGQPVEVRLTASATEQTLTVQDNSQNISRATTYPITNAHALEKALVKLLWSLSSGQSNNQISLSVVGTQFANVYHEPLSKVLKRIGEPKGVPKFLAKCNSLRTQKNGKDWWVTLVCVSSSSNKNLAKP